MMRRLPSVAGGLLALALLGSQPASSRAQQASVPAPATQRSEIYVPVGLAAFAGQSHLLVGLGGGIGYRYAASDRVSLYVDARLGQYTGTVGTVAGGASLGLHHRGWNPQLGLGFLAFLGDGVRILSSSEPTLPPKAAFALALRVSPLRFVYGRLSGSALSTDLGCGLEPSGCVLAMSVSILETGIRF